LKAIVATNAVGKDFRSVQAVMIEYLNLTRKPNVVTVD